MFKPLKIIFNNLCRSVKPLLRSKRKQALYNQARNQYKAMLQADPKGTTRIYGESCINETIYIDYFTDSITPSRRIKKFVDAKITEIAKQLLENSDNAPRAHKDISNE